MAISHLTHIIRGNVYIVIHMEITRVTSIGFKYAEKFDNYVAVWSYVQKVNLKMAKIQ